MSIENEEGLLIATEDAEYEKAFSLQVDDAVGGVMDVIIGVVRDSMDTWNKEICDAVIDSICTGPSNGPLIDAIVNSVADAQCAAGDEGAGTLIRVVNEVYKGKPIEYTIRNGEYLITHGLDIPERTGKHTKRAFHAWLVKTGKV